MNHGVAMQLYSMRHHYSTWTNIYSLFTYNFWHNSVLRTSMEEIIIISQLKQNYWKFQYMIIEIIIIIIYIIENIFKHPIISNTFKYLYTKTAWYVINNSVTSTNKPKQFSQYHHYTTASIITTLQSVSTLHYTTCLNFWHGKRFSSFPKCPHLVWGPPSLLFSKYCSSFHRLMQLEHNVDHSSPSSAAVCVTGANYSAAVWRERTVRLLCVWRERTVRLLCVTGANCSAAVCVRRERTVRLLCDGSELFGCCYVLEEYATCNFSI